MRLTSECNEREVVGTRVAQPGGRGMQISRTRREENPRVALKRVSVFCCGTRLLLAGGRGRGIINIEANVWITTCILASLSSYFSDYFPLSNQIGRTSIFLVSSCLSVIFLAKNYQIKLSERRFF